MDNTKNLFHQFRRVEDQPVDYDTVVANRAALDDYLALPSTVYEGQVIWVEDENVAVLVRDRENTGAEVLQAASTFKATTADDTSTILSPVDARVGLSAGDLWHTKTTLLCRTATEDVAVWEVNALWKANHDATPSLRRANTPTVRVLAGDNTARELGVQTSIYASILPTLEVTGLPSTEVDWKAETEILAMSG